MDAVQLYKAMADDTRLRTLMLIQQERELCVCELTEALSLSQPKISRHLAQLRKVGLLLTRKEGQWVYYRINDALPSWCRDVLAVTLRENVDWLGANVAALKSMCQRPASRLSCC